MRNVTWDSVVAGCYRGGDYRLLEDSEHETVARIVGFTLEDSRVVVHAEWILCRNHPEAPWRVQKSTCATFVCRTDMPRVIERTDGVLWLPTHIGRVSAKIYPGRLALPFNELPQLIRDKYPRAVAA